MDQPTSDAQRDGEAFGIEGRAARCHPGLEQLTFDSRWDGEAFGFEGYRELYRLGTDVSCEGEHFSARIAARRYPGLVVFDRTLRGLAHERSRKRVINDGFEHTVVQLVLDGRLGVTIGEERKWVGPGEIVAFDMRKPQRTWTDGARYITVSFPIELAEGSLPAAADFHGHVFKGGAAPVTSEHIRALAACDASLDPGTAAAVSARTELLLGSMFGTIASPAPNRGTMAEIKLRRALRFIRLSVGRGDLSPTLIAERIGVSRSVLYRLFEPYGGVGRSIQRQRLLAMRRALGRDQRSIAAIARQCGFVSEAHACRSFRDEFDATPGRYRTLTHGNAYGADMIEQWITDLQ